MSTTGTPTFETAPDYDMFALISDPTCPVGRDAVQLFLDACEADAASNHGFVSVNRVRKRLAEVAADIPHKRYSAFWSHMTGAGRPMRKATSADRPAHLAPSEPWEPWEVCSGSPTKNDGRPYPLRVWVGAGVPNFVTTSSTGENQ